MKYINKYWLFIYPYVFIFKKGNEVLFYNSRIGSFIYCNSSEITDQLINPENLYSIPIYLKHLHGKRSYSLINNLILQKSGELIPADTNSFKPNSILPQLIIDDFVGGISSNKNFKRFSELKELTLFINGQCSKNCKNCSISFKQHIWCHKQVGEITFEKIRQFLSFLPLSGIIKLNISGADVFSYPELKQLIIFLNQFNIVKDFFIHSTLIVDKVNELEWFIDTKNKFSILYEPMCEKGLFKEVLEIISKKRISSRYIMAVTSVEEYEYAASITDGYQIDLKILPIYTGENRDFFENHIYLNKDDIHNNHVSMREIFSHQVLNTNNFGQLVLSSDEKIYANINNNSIGTINDDIYRLVDHQLKKGSCWRNIRNNSICSACIYQWLCPSISGYNFVLNQVNLCNIKTGSYSNLKTAIDYK